MNEIDKPTIQRVLDILKEEEKRVMYEEKMREIDVFDRLDEIGVIEQKLKKLL